MPHIGQPDLRVVSGVIVLFGALLSALGAPGRASACSCRGWTEAEAFANADVVFRGRLESNDVTDADSPATNGVVALEFAVERVFKGSAAEQQTVLTAGDSSSCGFLGRVGLDHLVFAAKGETGLIEVGESDLSTNLCAGTRLVAPGDVVPASFGAGVAPRPGAPAANPPPGDREGSLAWVAVLATVCLVAAGSVGVALRRR